MKRQKENKKIVIGITGGLGTGKSTVVRMLKSYGAAVIDADQIAHGIIKPGKKIYLKLVETFGKKILGRNKNIDRKKLARAAFRNKNSLRKLNLIMHPEIIQAIKEGIKKSPRKAVVVDAPLLIEAGLRGLVDKIIVVRAERETQLKRLLGKRRLTKKDIARRIKVQMPLEKKFCFADFIIDNSGSREKTRRQVAGIWKTLEN
ncbi:MAG: dephospho-CoA kinase [Candidatus Omnitrophota bacterium]|nr:MAG: dephospho-CoA kinase [Candidatus Omnitrophota bacterium]